VRKESIYVCPGTQSKLQLRIFEAIEDEVISGVLISEEGIGYPINDGVPNLSYELAEQDMQARTFYDGRVEAYDRYLHLTFKTHEVSEQGSRNRFVDALELQPLDRVLEIAAGTGRDSEIIARRLDRGELWVQDISAEMLDRCRARLAETATEFCVSNGCYLPYPNGYFDAVYSFGGLGEFSDIKRGLAEMVRVSKIGAKVVVGDESIPPWLRNTEFAKILVTTNKQFLARVPLEEMPIEARDVRLRWVIGGVFYLIDFRVGVGEPTADFDFEIPGTRGGTYRTRYEGQLEGVKPETKRLAERAAAKGGISRHEWLDAVVREAALKDLGV
jgi:ubiquinone/menaquinone biosynthesis C-methylase UbiE